METSPLQRQSRGSTRGVLCAVLSGVLFAAGRSCLAQYAPYQQRIYEQSRREGERKLDAYLDQAYQPNPRFSSSTPAFDNYLNQLRARAEEERQRRAERRYATPTYSAAQIAEWARQSREAAEAEERRLQLAQWDDYKRRGRGGDAQAACAVALTLMKASPRLPAGETTGLAGARPWFELAARNGSAPAARHLAVLLQQASPGRPSKDAFDLYRRAVELGDLDVIPVAADLALSGGEGFAPDAAEAWRLCQVGVARGHRPSMRTAAILVQRRPNPGPEERRQAMAWLEEASATDPLAAGQLALVLYDGWKGVAQDRGRAVALARQTLAKQPQLAVLDELLGKARLTGEGGETRDAAQALAHLKRAAEGGLISAADTLARCYSTGEAGFARSPAQARGWREHAARLGDMTDAYVCAYQYHHDSPPNLAKAAEFYELASRAGHEDSAYELARLWHRGAAGVPARPAEARKLLRQASETRFPKAWALYGLFCLDGTGGPRDPVEAARWMERAARSGLPLAQKTYAVMLFEGKGLERNDTEALEWLRRAAEQGEPEAMAQLATLLVEGGICPQDLSMARQWALKSAEAGSALGQRIYAEFLRRGEGGPLDGPGAVHWHTRARGQGDANALLALGEIFRDGLPGVPPDRTRAREAFAEAARAGDTEVATAASAALERLDAAPARVSVADLRIHRPSGPSLFESLRLVPAPATNRTTSPRLDRLRLE